MRDSLIEAVEMRLMSDVPIGAFLSGGVDSTAVVGIMRRALGKPVQTFTVGFDMATGGRDDKKFNVDTRYATLAAQRLQTDHHTITMRQDESLSALLPHLVYSMDEPVAEQAIFQTAHVAALARHRGIPVLLTGDCGDELFAGYSHYRADRALERYLRLPKLLRDNILVPLFERLPARFEPLRKLAHKSHETDWTDRYLAWKRIIALDQFPSLLTDAVHARGGYGAVDAALRSSLNTPRTRYFADRLAYTGLVSWIAEDSNMRVDKMSMLMSTEARAPFEDHHLVELALRIPLQHKLRGGDFKTVLKDSVADFVPREILERPKWGFQPPISDWLRTALRPAVETFLASERVAAAGFFRPEAVADLIDRHIRQHKYEVWALWALLVFHVWYALYIDQSLTLSHTLSAAELVEGIDRVRK